MGSATDYADSGCGNGSGSGSECVDSGTPVMVCGGAQTARACGGWQRLGASALARRAMESSDDEKIVNGDLGGTDSVRPQSDSHSGVARDCENVSSCDADGIATCFSTWIWSRIASHDDGSDDASANFFRAYDDASDFASGFDSYCDCASCCSVHSLVVPLAPPDEAFPAYPSAVVV